MRNVAQTGQLVALALTAICIDLLVRVRQSAGSKQSAKGRKTHRASQLGSASPDSIAASSRPVPTSPAAPSFRATR